MDDRHNDDIDLVHFDHRKNIDEIRQKEMQDREIRAKRIAAARRAEKRRIARQQKIRETVTAWAILIGVILAVILGVMGIVKAIKGRGDKNDEKGENAVSAEQTALVDGFTSAEVTVYSTENDSTYKAANSLIGAFTLSSNADIAVPEFDASPSSFLWMVKRYAWYTDRTNINKVKEYIRDCAMYSNGYIWSSENSMKSEVSGNYLYDTNARFISAVSEVCLWEGDTSFLYEADVTGQPKLDISKDMTVLEKVEKAAAHYFETGDVNGGGIRYNETDGLVYVMTQTNDASSAGAGSNYWFNHRFGYLDAYNNIAFNEAMQYLSKLYALMGQTDKADSYSAIAQKNKDAVNSTFWDANTGRYFGAKDAAGNTHDLGFVFLNLEAVSSGIADSEKSDLIFSWIDGKREIATDTSRGDDIYSFGFAPRSTTVSATDSWWDYVDGRYPLSSSAQFGLYWQNGGCALLSEYYDLAARKLAYPSSFENRIKALTDRYNDGKILITTPETKEGISGRAECGVTPTAFIYSMFGISTDGVTLTVDPSLHSYTGAVGIKNICFSATTYGFMFDSENTYIISSSNTAVRLRLGGYKAGEKCEVKTVEKGVVTSTEPVTATDGGFLEISERFGADSYIFIAREKTEEKAEK